MRQILLIRHGKTDANRLTRAAYGQSGAPLNATGIAQAQSIMQQLVLRSIHPDEPVAVSELLRTQQTAQYAGFKNYTVYPCLNEVQTSDPAATVELIEKGLLPLEATNAAKIILATQPKEKIWVTHGLVIAAILQEIGEPLNTKLIPDFCEIVPMCMYP